MNSKLSNIGDYNHLIRINGRRSILGCGHTPQESVKNALDAAQECWPHNAHIFDLLRPLPAHKRLASNKPEQAA